MKKYNTPSLEVYEVEVIDTITASTLFTAPQFVKGTNSSNTTSGAETGWNNAWEID